MALEKIITQLKAKFGTDVISAVDENASPPALIIDVENLHKVCAELYSNEETYFDMLSCITGIDNGPEMNTMEVAYNLYSIPFEQSLMIKVTLDRGNPEIVSLYDIWKSADWLEREVFDLFGIRFTGHPDLRRILLPADWKGYPLRKDYKHEEYYRGIKIEY